MHTTRVDVCYRPLRIGWAIRSDDISAFRKAVRMSHALWGGRFNPILLVDQADAAELVDAFRLDLIWPVEQVDEVRAFVCQYPHLRKPFPFYDRLFLHSATSRPQAQVLDVHNAIAHLIDTPVWNAILRSGVRLYKWDSDDPLADVFLMQLGAYPEVGETGFDYLAMLRELSAATDCEIDATEPIPPEILDHPGIADVSVHGLQRHYTAQTSMAAPGFFAGDASNVRDLIWHWNLRAANIPLWFVDVRFRERYAKIISAWHETTRHRLTRLRQWPELVGVWARPESMTEARSLIGDAGVLECPVSHELWNGGHFTVPMMHLGSASVLGTVANDGPCAHISFALNERPFSGDVEFYQQRLVASVAFAGLPSEDSEQTVAPPYIPELNEFYSRRMVFHPDRIRAEPGRIGIVVDAADTDAFLRALPVPELVERIFEIAGFDVKLSSGGLIARQLVSRLGGLQGARVFKIPGVRRLLRTHGPTSAFSKSGALQLIASKDPDNLGARFSDYVDLCIEPRSLSTPLVPSDVFSYMVDKGLFRIGVELTCPTCRMTDWIALDVLKQAMTCDLCGCGYNATRQLVSAEWRYRRSGVLGAERNTQGAIPVVLTLQQLDTNLTRLLLPTLYSTSIELTPKASAILPTCEVDLVWIVPRAFPRRTAVLIGECKEGCSIDADDFDRLERVAAALPRKRFKTFILLSKVSPFTEEELRRARDLKARGQRVILLSARELEPYEIYERVRSDSGVQWHGDTPEELVKATARLYLSTEAAG